MCTAEPVVGKIVEEIVGGVIKAVGHQLDYLFQYKKNIENLEVELKGLKENEETISTQIDEAETRSEVIDVKVSNWKNRAGSMIQEVETFVKENAGKESFQCFKFSCPDFISRYKLSKRAKEKTDAVKNLSKNAHFDKIAHRKPPPPELLFPSIGDYMHFDSRALIFDKIMEALRNSKVNVIGIYGIGGVGKTTMVEKLGEQVGKKEQMGENGHFDEVVMAVVSHDANVAKIQGVLADRLSLILEKETEEGRAGELWNRLNNGKRNLVILDDIWNQLNLKKIGIPITDGNKGCKVVLTSRSRQVLKKVGGDSEEAYKDFPIDVLSEEDAWILFEKKAGNNIDPRGPLHDTARKVCKECGGLPVAIRAVAAALKHKSLPDWRRSLVKLQKSMINNVVKDVDPKLLTSLKLSYDFLNSEDEKSCFLLCCSFPEDAQVPIVELAMHYMARRLFHDQYDLDTLQDARDIVGSVVDTLKTSCLLLDGENDDFVKMHDVVRDVAILIAKEENAFLVKHGVEEWPEIEVYEKFSAISFRSETIRKLPDELVCPELHTLMLDYVKHGESWYVRELWIDIPDKFFSGTEKLTVLELNGANMSPLPSSLEKLTELRMLCLTECKLGDITMLKCLKNKLEVLSLQGSDIKALPHEVGELTRLRLLDLRYCSQLRVIPNGVISKLLWLEELYFPFRFFNWEAATGNEERSKVSLDELTSLTRLSTLDIRVPNLRRLPVELFFRNLIRFHIRVGDQIEWQWGNEPWYSMQGVMTIWGKWSDDDLNIWERLLGKPKWFNNLTQLVIEGCDSLKYLFSPSSARELQQLQLLEIERCEMLESVIRNGETEEEIIENPINFSQLKILKLRYLPCLINFYPGIKKATTGSQSLPPAQVLFNEKVAFPVLEQLTIGSMPKLMEIWDKDVLPAKSFCLLRSLEVRNCGKLMYVIPSHMLPLLQNIESLIIEKTPEMEVIVVMEKRDEETQEASNTAIIWFPKLTKLKLRQLENLKDFFAYSSEGQLFFNKQVTFTADSSSTESRMKDTSIITETQPLFNHKVAFPALEELTIDSMPNITEIWDKNVLSAQSFCLLRSLEVCNCGKLIMNVIPSHMLPVLHNIRSLKIEEFSEMEAIVVLEKRDEETQEATNTAIIQFPKLTELKLGQLENLKGVCAYKSEGQLNFNVQSTLPALETLMIESLPTITAIWSMQTFIVPENIAESSFSQSRINDISLITETRPLFNLQGCETLINADESRMHPVIQNIKYLNVSKCSKMEVIIFLEKREEAAEEATSKDIIEFPKLWRLCLRELEQLKGVCAYKSRDQLYFDVRSTLPALETLMIESLPMITAIWSMQTFIVPENIAESSFSQSRINDISLITETRPLFNLQGCETLKNAVPSRMHPVIQNIKELHVSKCSKMEVIIVLEKREEAAEEATSKDIIEFPKVRHLTLVQLEQLKGVCAYKSKDQLYFDMQVVFPELYYDLYLDEHAQKIFKKAISGNKEMMDCFACHYPEMISDDSEEEDVLEDEDEETHEKEKAGPSEKGSTKATTRTPIPHQDDSQDEFKDGDEETPKKADPNQKSLTKSKAAIKSLGPDEDDLEDEDNSREEDEETPEKTGPSERKPIESATKTPILGEDNKKDEYEETPKNAKVGPTRKG